jgi:hypothetical protein
MIANTNTNMDSTITIQRGHTNAIKVNFKEVWGENVKGYFINPEWTTRQMLVRVTPLIETDFNISNFELVLCGQDIPIMELGTPLPINDNTVIKRDILGPEMRQIAFYIRRLNYQYPQMANLN